MLTPDAHRLLLQSFTLEQLLTLLELDAKRFHDGHYTLFRFGSGFKVAFGTPDINPPGCRQQGYVQLHEMIHSPTLKDAVLEALVSGKTFDDYFAGDEEAWWAQQHPWEPWSAAFLPRSQAVP